jgi:predicted CoA-substrate-specific enzyme activase
MKTTKSNFTNQDIFCYNCKHYMNYSVGIDIGSINARLALVGDDQIINLDTEKITSGHKAAVATLLRRLSQRISPDEINGVGLSGSGKSAIPDSLKWSVYSSPLAIVSGILHSSPDAKTIVQIGGQSSDIIILEDGLNKPWKVSSNPLCAAGTGRFMEQQAYRLGIDINEFAAIALLCQDAPPRIAARCSVFAKTDLIHLQQKGVSVESMLYALCESIARMVTSLHKGIFPEPVYFVGGVASNSAIVKALSELFSQRNNHKVEVLVPENYRYIEAIGSALLAKNRKSAGIVLPEENNSKALFQLPKLETTTTEYYANGNKITTKQNGYLGIDVGSTSTKAVILDESGKILLAKHYLMTAGKPIDAVKDVFRNLLDRGSGNISIRSAGVTGSGRYLIGSLIGADLIKNEITAQTRAAAEIDPDADIIEIGGQDSKLIIKRNGVVIDYQMNKACAAGTGSFIDELAEMLGVSVKDGEFAQLAFKAPYTVDLGTRCAAFMGQAVASAQQEGVPIEILAASLSNSIAGNYLSKVVGNRKLGNKIILTGAVFYNQAIISAFRAKLNDKELRVAENNEVTGAIGAALLARENHKRDASKFRGFETVINTTCDLSYFTCKGCDNNCTITRMQMPGQPLTFYGSRCDKYDSAASSTKQGTAFDDREKLLFNRIKEKTSAIKTVGIPRALLVYDFAPLMIGFLNELNVKTTLSRKTTKEIIEKSSELAYSDSCFPMKLVHGHAAELADNDYILFPSSIRLGTKDGDENQKYACPLVQASPFIIRTVLDLNKKLLSPILDFSLGDAEVISNLTGAAVEMGFSKGQGRKAAIAGLQMQRQFEQEKVLAGEKLLDSLAASKKLGVVLMSRAYMSQDSGANLGIAEKLAQLGVVPIPLDFLPLSTVSPKQFSDRPYWYYESKLAAAASIIEKNPQLYGLILSNFGCGPNSFILRLVEDIMGNKPLGQLEIDEHAAEAGIVTRLEAFVDTIENYARSSISAKQAEKSVYRGATSRVNTGKTLLVPRMSPQAHAVAAAMEASGAKAIVLPEPDINNLIYGNQMTTGTECLPYRITLGDFIRFVKENGNDISRYEGFAAGSFGPCRLGKYTIEQMKILREMGIDLPIRTTVSNNAYRDLNLGPGFQRLAWNGIVATDFLLKLLWRCRPYERQSGAMDMLFNDYVNKIADQTRLSAPLKPVLKLAVSEFQSAVDKSIPRKPLIGINGEIFLRSNNFSNNNLVKACEQSGLEVTVSSMSEWMKYTAYRNLEDAIRFRKPLKIVTSFISNQIQNKDEAAIASSFTGIVDILESPTKHVLMETKKYFSPRCGSEAVLSIGTGLEWLKNPEFSGVISVMPHGCMPGGIVAAMADKFSSRYNKPWISLTYDGFMETNNSSKINSFAEVIRYTRKSAAG